MNMKKLLVSAVLGIFAVVCATAATREEIQAKIARQVAEQGGVITLMPTGNVVRIVNAQKAVPASFFDPLVKDVTTIGIAAPMVVSDATKLIGKDPIMLAKGSLLTPKTGAVIAFVEVKDFPTLLVAPENAWTIVNVRNLKADNPSKTVLEQRLVKEFWRGLAAGMGAMHTLMGACVMRPVGNLAGLDRLNANRLGSEATMKVIASLPAYGIDRIEKMTYAEACEMGVAPPPTNDVQKAIWKAAHDAKERGPTNALQIVPPKK